jgi:hypothetical protein
MKVRFILYNKLEKLNCLSDDIAVIAADFPFIPSKLITKGMRKLSGCIHGSFSDINYETLKMDIEQLYIALTVNGGNKTIYFVLPSFQSKNCRSFYVKLYNAVKSICPNYGFIMDAFIMPLNAEENKKAKKSNVKETNNSKAVEDNAKKELLRLNPIVIDDTAINWYIDRPDSYVVVGFNSIPMSFNSEKCFNHKSLPQLYIGKKPTEYLLKIDSLKTLLKPVKGLRSKRNLIIYCRKSDKRLCYQTLGINKKVILDDVQDKSKVLPIVDFLMPTFNSSIANKRVKNRSLPLYV